MGGTVRPVKMEAQNGRDAEVYRSADHYKRHNGLFRTELTARRKREEKALKGN